MREMSTNEKNESNESAIIAFLFMGTAGLTGSAVTYAITELFNVHSSVIEAVIVIFMITFYMSIFYNAYKSILL
ncbi:hypothetical protein [Natrinema salsiterrestre]|uniref:Uncharacterized protein n=1 Tax=Natrinema salsiterrestre TaxID=2950540 RepID=A0A9Q4L2F0_9EURY|nr:hypothetical protein [Natrinema salsiterrestre]MDF9745272.1 hypothetical protein [Natrinema salsiterrestre]